MIIIKAVIMSGGQGTRLRPLTNQLPKPMVPILGKPVMEYAVELLLKHNIKDIGVTLHYLPFHIIDYFNDGSDCGVNMKYFIEDKPLGTGGSVKNAGNFLDDTFIVVSGDAFTNIDLESAIRFHKEKGSKATLVLKREPIPLEYGVVITDENGRITRFLEKPSWGEVFSDTINTGIYILEPEVMDYYKKDENFDFSKDLFPRLLEDKIPMFGYVTDEYWCDVGDLNTYINTHRDILSGKAEGNLKSYEISEGIWVGQNTIIEDGVKIDPPVYIGNNNVIKKGTVLDSYTVIGDNCYIDRNNYLKGTVLWDNVQVANEVEIRRAIICNNITINKKVKIKEDTAIGSYSKIDTEAYIQKGIKIWPNKKVGEKMVIGENVIWSTKMTNKIFGYRNVSGKIDEDLTPERVTKLGIAFGSCMKNGGKYIVSCDGSNISKAMKNCITTGLLFSGGKVVDIGNSPISVSRFGIRFFGGDGGLYIKSSNTDKNKIFIEFIDKSGSNIDRNMERKIENCLTTEDFVRCNGETLDKVVEVDNFYSIYKEEGQKTVNNRALIKKNKPKILIASKSDNLLPLVEEYLSSLGCIVKTVDRSNKFKDEVVREEADLGIFYEDNGENIFLVDNKGRIIKNEKYFLLASLLGLKSGEIEEIVIPYNFPSVINEIVDKYRGKIVISKTYPTEVMREMIKKDYFCQYILNFDPIWGSGKIIDYLVEDKNKLSELVDQLPDYHYIKRELPCNWEDKGRIIRQLIEESEDKIEMFEGIKINNEKGWALILPDKERPNFNIYIEGFEEEYAEELSSLYEEKIKTMLEDNT